MMGFYGRNIMDGSFGLVGSTFCIIILVVLVLLGIWLFKQIQKK